MKKFAAAAALACALLSVLATAASASKSHASDTPAIAWGVADDSSKYADDGGKWFDGELKTENLGTNRWTLAWNPSNPTAITELPFVQRAAPVAQANGIHVILSLYAGQNGGSSPDATDHDPTAFCNWAKIVAQTVKQWGIDSFIIWNEPSSTLYWNPQKTDPGQKTTANDVAAPAYETLLASCYDQLHSLDGGGWTADVIGMGLSAKASKNTSNEPLAFLRDVGAAYKASGRSTPIMDQLSLHPYPLPSTNPSPDKGYSSAAPDDFGPPDLARVKQAVYDAFNGTGQPTTLNGLTFVLDEFGWQTSTSSATDFSATDAAALASYSGTENAGPPGSAAAVSETTQAQYIAQAVGMFACDPTVTNVNLFLLVDEATRTGWQSGLMTTGGEGKSLPKAAFAASAPLFAAGRGACTTGTVSWTPTTSGGSSGGGSSKGGGSAGKGGGSAGKSGGSGSKDGSTKSKGATSGSCTKSTKVAAGYTCKIAKGKKTGTVKKGKLVKKVVKKH
jgi:hypothetical protein